MKLKYQNFLEPNRVTLWVNQNPNIKIVSITYDTRSGYYVMFYYE